MIWTPRPADPQTVADLSQSLNGLSPALSHSLVARGVTTYDEARTYFRAGPEAFHDPFLLKGMDAAVRRIQKAKSQGNDVALVSDYDVDGTTSASVVKTLFARMGIPIRIYTPSRFETGYGLTDALIDKILADGSPDLLITVDCGVTAIPQVARLRKQGVEALIIDHHLPKDDLPDAIIIDAKQPGCPYPFKELCAAGVAWKLACALIGDRAHDMLDMVAVATSADVVPATGENRVIIREGTRKIATTERIGLLALCSVAGVDPTNISPSAFGFAIGPRLNAAGRIQSAEIVTQLLTTTDPAEAEWIASKLDSLNAERKKYSAEAFEQAVAQAEQAPSDLAGLVLHIDGHPGVLGIAASKVAERYRKPVILVSGEEFLSGSARSFGDINVHLALSHTAEMLTRFGGHAFAAGVSLSADRLPDFQSSFSDAVSLQPPPKEEILYDTDLPIGSVTKRFYNTLRQFSPYGPGNPEPLFRVEGTVTSAGRRIGNDKTHLKFKTEELDCIAFGQGDDVDLVADGAQIEMLASPEVNHWMGRESMQLQVKAVRSR